MDKTERIFTIAKPSEPIELQGNTSQCNWKPYIWILVMIIVHLSGIVIGIIFRNECPLEKNIPRWEMINGCLMISFLSLIFLPKQQTTKNDQLQSIHRNWTMFLIDQSKILISLVFFASFILGNIWVFKHWRKVHYDKASISMKDFYCNKISYLYAFWYMMTIYVLLTLCLIYSIVSLIYKCMKNSGERK